MLNGLVKLLGSVGNAVHGVEQTAGNAFHALTNHPPVTLNAPQTTTPMNNPLSAGRVWGQAVTNNVADQQKYSPYFRGVVTGAKPFVNSGASTLIPGAGGAYLPAQNQISLNSNQLDPYTVTHEGLHAQWQREAPQQQQQFLQTAQQGLNPQARNLIGRTLATPLYKNTQGMSSIPSLLTNLANEVHSMSPQYSAMLPNSPALSQYYSQLFGNNNFVDPAKMTAYKIRDMTTPVPPPQFNDWQQQ